VETGKQRGFFGKPGLLFSLNLGHFFPQIVLSWPGRAGLDDFLLPYTRGPVSLSLLRRGIRGEFCSLDSRPSVPTLPIFSDFRND